MNGHEPVHVTVRLVRGLPRLRDKRTYEVLRRCFVAGDQAGDVEVRVREQQLEDAQSAIAGGADDLHAVGHLSLLERDAVTRRWAVQDRGGLGRVKAGDGGSG